ncbi:Rcs stress response system protein RcsF [Klebsiella pasteurii]
MRALPVCLLALMLSGCSMLSRSPVEPVQSTVTPPAKSEPAKPKATRPAPVRIYTDATELVGKPFRELGEVTGESCQASNQDSPPNIPTARKRMQINAAKMKANAVLLHSCEVTSGTPGCYRQAVCLGSALNVTAQ